MLFKKSMMSAINRAKAKAEEKAGVKNDPMRSLARMGATAMLGVPARMRDEKQPRKPIDPMTGEESDLNVV